MGFIKKKKKRQKWKLSFFSRWETLVCFDTSGWRSLDRQHSGQSSNTSSSQTAADWYEETPRDRGGRQDYFSVRMLQTLKPLLQSCERKHEAGEESEICRPVWTSSYSLLLFGSQLSTDFHDKAARLCFRTETGTLITINDIKLNWLLAI